MDVKTTSKRFVIKASLIVFSLLPLSVARALGVVIGKLLWIIPNRSKETTLTNLRLCYPQYLQSEIQQQAQSSLVETAKFGCEMGSTWIWSPQRCAKFIKQVHGAQVLQDAHNKQQGVLIILPHLGNWEMIGAYIAPRYTVTALYQPPKIQALESIIVNARERNIVSMVPTTSRGVARLMRALKAGETVVILSDQEPDAENSGVYVPFMGVSALTMTLVPKLLQKTSATAVFSFVIRKDAGYALHILPAEEAIYSADETIAAAAMNRGIEQCIAYAPNQYQWEYKRFKSQADNQKFYKK